MTFKSKLAIAFSSVLALTIVVSVTNWWGMETVIRKQNEIAAFTSVIEERFGEIIDIEQHYRSTKDPNDIQSMQNGIEQLRSELGVLLQPQGRRSKTAQQKLFTELDRYESSFLRYSRSAIAMQTMKSRMTKESEKLLESAQTLVQRTISGNERIPASEIAYRVSLILINGNRYLLDAGPGATDRLMAAIGNLSQLTSTAMSAMPEDIQKLEIYRIKKAAFIYQEILTSFIVEKEHLDEADTSMQQTHETFSRALASHLAEQHAKTEQNISRLQTISVLISIIAICVGVAAVLFLSNMIIHPLNELKKSARSVVDGDLDTFVTRTGNDDIGELGSIFNQMTARLKESFSDVEEYRHYLESLVSRRTEKLEVEIKQRMQAEEELRKSSERLNNIFEQSPMGIIIFDNEFNILEWNPSCEKIFGYPRSEIVGKPAITIVPDEVKAQVQQMFGALLKSGHTIKNQNDNRTRDGRVILCDWYNTPLTDSSNNTMGMLSLVEDVTERVRADQELLKVKKLESTGVLAGGIAHDFNNLLTAIMGSINLVMMDGMLSDRSKQLMINAEKASKRAQTLTQQLLTFAKGGEPLREQTSIVDVIKDSADFVLRGSSTSTTYELPEDLWFVEADKGQLSQVIQNIVLNASQAMPNGGNVRISCENLPKEKTRQDPLLDIADYVKLTITDNGIGMPRQVLEKIFDPYFSTKPGGSGLGLAITLSIINKHNGHIKAESEPGAGTKFTIFLRASSEQNAPTSDEAEEQQTNVLARILLMDDEQMILDVAGEMIRSLGHTVYFSKNGDECIEIYTRLLQEATPPDLVIMDLTIPGGKGGEETLRELQKINPGVKAIVSSGYSNNPLMSKHRKIGFYGAISKPYVTEELSRVIQSTLQTASFS